jgi:hypothetical protein
MIEEVTGKVATMLEDERSRMAAAIEAERTRADAAAARSREAAMAAADHGLRAAAAQESAEYIAAEKEELEATLEELEATLEELEASLAAAGLYTLNAVDDPLLASAWFQPLILSLDPITRSYQVKQLVSKFAGFKCNLYHYTAARGELDVTRTKLWEAEEAAAEVGLYKLNPLEPWLEGAWFQPSNL